MNDIYFSSSSVGFSLDAYLGKTTLKIQGNWNPQTETVTSAAARSGQGTERHLSSHLQSQPSAKLKLMMQRAVKSKDLPVFHCIFLKWVMWYEYIPVQHMEKIADSSTYQWVDSKHSTFVGNSFLLYKDEAIF